MTAPQESAPPAVVVVTTVDTPDRAESLAAAAVEARLAACVQIVGPVTSVYRWQGAVEDAREWQLHLKTAEERYPALEEWLLRHHDYDTPEILATPVTGGSSAYLRWIAEETAPDAG
ncbi:divalent-cation tolerance protein CutA [Streptomyces sp. SID8014]|uniref:divalent-cation tolerance protein CutA n=1 Tax=Streptomyces sp. SID8014 TaxID=2706097 RepID=UPI0013B62998|nr:divalent-cation tolerance protein CutA [Streptomyces sp. SID8014]NEC15128.1 divalent-cation tolerance protein CutA [Streptomyces sp. SID8014]